MLKITLKPGERIVVNGAVVTAAGRADLMFENKAAILRGREVMGPAEATGPACALYFAIQMAYIDPDRIEMHRVAILDAAAAVMATAALDGQATCARAAHRVALGDYYGALTALRPLIAAERAAATAAAA